MASSALVRSEIEEGMNLVRALDESDFGLVAALWVYDSDLDRWRMTVAYDGPQRDIKAKRLQAAEIAHIWRNSHPSEPFLELGWVTVTSSEDRLVTGLRPLAPMDGVGERRIRNRVVNGIYVEDALIHRMAA